MTCCQEAGISVKLLLTHRPSDKICNNLSKRPVNTQNSQEILVRRRQELEENCRVDGQVSTNTKGPESCKDADCWPGRRTGCDHAEDRGNPEGQVEGPLATKDVTTETPEHGTYE